MIIDPIADLLIKAGFTDGWAVTDGVLVIWEHEQDPPAPLQRPNETPTADA